MTADEVAMNSRVRRTSRMGIRGPYNGAAGVASRHGAGKLLLGMALILAILGVGASVLAKLGAERLPATLTWRSDNVTVFVPIGLMVVVSIVATILLNVFLRR